MGRPQPEEEAALGLFVWDCISLWCGLSSRTALPQSSSSCAASAPHCDAVCEDALYGGPGEVEQQFLGLELCFLRKDSCLLFQKKRFLSKQRSTGPAADVQLEADYLQCWGLTEYMYCRYYLKYKI